MLILQKARDKIMNEEITVCKGNINHEIRKL